MSTGSRFCAHVALLLMCLLATPCVAQAFGARAQAYHAGMRTLGIWNPTTASRLDATVWYPSLRAPSEIRLEGRVLYVSRNGRVVPGNYPVILMSHDAGGSRIANHDLAAALAREGFVVIAPTHPGDNDKDTSALYTTALLAERPRHLLLALDAALAVPELAGIMNEYRIGLLGVGSGSATALQLAGAVPELGGLVSYCAEGAGQDPFCSDWSKLHLPAMLTDYARILTAPGSQVFTPSLQQTSLPHPPEPEPRKSDDLDAELAALQANDADPAASQPQNATTKAAVEARAARRDATGRHILGIGLMTPGLAVLFSQSSLQAVTTPVAILAAEEDAIYLSQRNAARLQNQLPQRPAYMLLRGAGHYALQAPCPPAFAQPFASLCGEAGTEDNAMRLERNSFFSRFFHRVLDEPGTL